MYASTYEKLPLSQRDAYITHQAEGGKAWLNLLCRPLLRNTPRYDTVRQVLEATASGLLTTAQAEAAIAQINRRRKAATVNGSLELTAEGLNAFALRLEKSCCCVETSLESLCTRLEDSCDRLEKSISERFGC